jgi:hypothetical protein
MAHVDWLTVSEVRPDGPDLVEDYLVSFDPDTGDVKYRTGSGVSLEGSYDSRIRIRSVDGRVTWSGNPSRFGRPDSLFGLGFPAAWAVVQETMAQVGLEPFSVCAPLHVPVHEHPDRLVDCGVSASIRRVDIAEVLAVDPAEDRHSVIRAMGQMTVHGKQPVHYGSGLRVGSRRGQQVVVYDKGEELKAHARGDDYQRSLASWASENGLLRWETRYGDQYLRHRGLDKVASWLEEGRWETEVQNVVDFRSNVIPSVGSGQLADVRPALVGAGVGGQLADRLSGYAYRWAAGEDVWSTIPAGSRYRHRRLLRDVCGIDIRRPLEDVTTLRVRPRVVDVQSVDAPSWHWAATA